MRKIEQIDAIFEDLEKNPPPNRTKPATFEDYCEGLLSGLQAKYKEVE
jgi:hypothetical protein